MSKTDPVPMASEGRWHVRILDEALKAQLVRYHGFMISRSTPPSKVWRTSM